MLLGGLVISKRAVLYVLCWELFLLSVDCGSGQEGNLLWIVSAGAGTARNCEGSSGTRGRSDLDLYQPNYLLSSCLFHKYSAYV